MTEPPVLRVVAGGLPTDEETAALTAVLTVVAAAQLNEGAQRQSRSRWAGGARGAPLWGRSGWLSDARRSALRLQR